MVSYGTWIRTPSGGFQIGIGKMIASPTYEFKHSKQSSDDSSLDFADSTCDVNQRWEALSWCESTGGKHSRDVN